jgi:hypothetical protein
MGMGCGTNYVSEKNFPMGISLNRIDNPFSS